MTCDELVAYLSDYLDHNLNAELTTSAQQHLVTCQNCQVVVRTTQQVIQLGQKHYQVSMPTLRRVRLLTHLQEAFLAARRDEADKQNGNPLEER